MRKIRSIIALTAVIAMAASTVVLAAPSPVAGVVTVVVPGSAGAKTAQVKTPTEKELKDIADFIIANCAAVGMTPSVKSTIDIVAPADYKGGDIPVVYAVAGLKDGAKNVFAYIRLVNGKTIIVPCTIRRGYVGFIAPAFGTVAIVELNPAAGTAVNAANSAKTSTAATTPAAAPATLH